MEQTPPIEWPTVTIEGVTYTLKYSLGVQYRASKAGVDMKAFADPARSLSAAVDLFAVIVAPQLEAMSLPVLTGEQWAEKIGTISVLAEIGSALGRALNLSKVSLTEAGPTPKTTADTDQRPN